MTDEAAEVARLREELDRCREALAEARLELEVLGATDGASGLPNRRGVIDAIEDAGNRLDRTGEGYAVLHVAVPVLATLGSEDRLEGVRHVAALRLDVGAAAHATRNRALALRGRNRHTAS